MVSTIESSTLAASARLHTSRRSLVIRFHDLLLQHALSIEKEPFNAIAWRITSTNSPFRA